MAAGSVSPNVDAVWPPDDRRIEQAAARDWAEAAGSEWRRAVDLYEYLARNSNHVDAVDRVPWERLLPQDATVLDLGCGSGWLTAKLTARPGVARVLAWDSSYRLLSEVLPDMLRLLDGDAAKVRTICADFTPLLLDDASVDTIVMASAFHHADRPRDLLGECHRVLRSGGRLLLLNEVPYPVPSMLRYVATTALAAALNAVTARVGIGKAGNVSADRILYDEELGDHAMTMAQWRRILGTAPFNVEVFDTGLPSYRAAFRKPPPLAHSLTHFFLERR